MGFYDELSKVYSTVFPADEDTISFLSKGMKKGSLILDAACGTGDFSIELAGRGYVVEGVDLSNDMIEIAKDNSEGLNVNFTYGDMTKIKEIYSGKSFDLIYCIGNSIVHLNDKNEVGKFIGDCYAMLKDNGRLIIQIVNYDRIIAGNVTSLPLIDKSDKGVKLERKYNYRKGEGIVDFITELTIIGNGVENRYNNSIPLIPLLHDELVNIIDSSGYRNIETYGSFKESAYVKNESYSLVIRADK